MRRRVYSNLIYEFTCDYSLSDFSIFYANSRLAAGIDTTPEMVKSAVHDVEVFLKDTHLQIKHKLDNGFHVSVERVVKDLEGLC